jgi:hypothetical protein
MRTKTMLISALLGSLGSIAVMAQTNVYSLNAVGYINVTLEPGFNIISCPLIATPDNRINTLLSNTNGQYKKMQVWSFNPTNNPQYAEELGSGGGWSLGGITTINPGQAVWFNNTSTNVLTATFVGTVPTSVTTTLYADSFNLVSSAIPAAGDIVTNSLMLFTNQVKKDQVWTYNPLTNPQYTEYLATAGGWPSGDPQEANVGGGFWYLNNQATNNYWVQNYSVSQ